MQTFERIAESISSVIRLGMILWFGAIFLFIGLVLAFAAIGNPWRETPEELAAQAKMRERQLAAELEAAQGHLDLESERALQEQGWGISGARSSKTSSASPHSEDWDDLAQEHTRRRDGWGQ